ncbi:MAG: hypothetical protein DRI95_09225 [Bacteroidetes bacterium]|nr:MAG: hypothetical protein DRI95_09225 [Bacteroidota bacterium]RLD76997.1 MAG: hypothetical protein DRJ07_15385 [Bacteroidota bacterium]
MNKTNQTKILFLFVIVLSITACNNDKATTPNKFYDSDNMLIVNGKRTFIIGSYHHPKTATPFKTLADNGYNYVRVTADSSQLDKAYKHNLYTWIYTTAVNEKDSAASKTKLINLINKYKDHPSLLFWEIEDEPAFTWNSPKARVSPEKMQKSFDIIKELDKKHVIITNHGPVNLISTLKKYNSSTDVVLVDVYPVIPNGIKPSYALFPDGFQGDLLNPYISQVGEYIEKMKKVVNNSKPVFAVLQGFSWEMLKKEEERDTSMILYPTYEQSRFMAYNAIVHGANGIVYWGTNYTPQPSPFINDLNRVTKELSEMQKVLSSKNTTNNIKQEYHELGYSVDAGVEFITKEISGKTYLISVNSDKNPVNITFSGLNKFKTVKVLTENRNITMQKGKFTDEYQAFGVHIYELE